MGSCLDRIQPHSEPPLAFAWRRWRIRRRFRRKLGRPLEERQPYWAEEKVQYRKLYGNHALYAFLADKYAVREFVRERVGENYLVPLYGVYDRLSPEIFRDLPDRFIIKATHGCKWHQIVKDKSQLDIAATVRRFNGYMRRLYGRTSGQYHYRLIPPRIVIEELLDEGGESPPDYDFFCYHNHEGFDYSLSVVMPHGTRAVHFEKDWSISGMTCTAAEAERVTNPANFAEMVEVAEKLSRGFDYVRIDLYNVAGRIYFGEVTCTPAGGFIAISDPARAEVAAQLWQLDRDNRFLYSTAPRSPARAA